MTLAFSIYSTFTQYEPHELYNCCTDLAEPDWSMFSNLELGGCINTAEDGSETTAIEGGIMRDEAEFFTVYGRLKEGGCDAITDCQNYGEAERIGLQLSEISGHALHIYC